MTQSLPQDQFEKSCWFEKRNKRASQGSAGWPTTACSAAKPITAMPGLLLVFKRYPSASSSKILVMVCNKVLLTLQIVELKRVNANDRSFPFNLCRRAWQYRAA